MRKQIQDRPVDGKQYALTGGMGQPSIAAGNTWAESEVKKCPACGRMNLNPNEARNALSRYCSKSICSPCGMREAFEGDFWHGNALYGELRPGAN